MINDYNYEPVPIFNKLSKEKLFLGIEIEMEAGEFSDRDNFSDEVDSSYSKYWYCKYDGSLSEGIELVSHPFSFQYYLQNRDKFIIPLLDDAKDNDFSSFNTSTCGMHVHMTRRTNTFHLYKILHFLHKSINSHFVKYISQRKKDSEFDEWCNIGIMDSSVKEIAKTQKSNKYTALRIKPKTIEIRIFKGNLNKKLVFKNIEFSHALYMFALEYSSKDMIFDKFINYILDNKKYYKHLIEFISKKYIGE